MIFGGLIIPWTRHVKSGRDLLRRSFEAANRTGDLTYAAYSCEQLNTNLLAAGDSLVDAQREFESGLAFARKVRFGLVIDLISAELGLVRTLRGLTRTFGSFDDEQFDEREIERRFTANRDLALAECWYSIRKLQARFFAGDYAAAVEAASTAQRLLWTAVSRFETAEYHFYAALAHAASCDVAAGEPRRRHIETVTDHHRQLEVWAANGPENFENRAALVGAELARIDGREVEAMRLYDKAIHSARANGFVHNEALASELAGRFYAARGFERIAHAYLQDARHCYLRWGAEGKVRQLEQLYPHLREAEPVPGPTSTIGAPVDNLDLATVIRVSQAVSGEIVLDKLIDTLMRTAIELAGAERGLLILPRGDELRIEAEATTRGDTVTVCVREASVAAAELPPSILQYVVRTRNSVIVDDASARNPFSADPYISQNHARSVLCLPLIKQATLIGVLYLENNLTSGVFTPARIAVLKLLASQAAISLENTRLYRDLHEREGKIREAQAELAHIARVSTLGEMAASIAHEVNQPLSGVVINANACLRFLMSPRPNLDEVRDGLQAIARDGRRASDVIERIRALARRTSTEKEPLDINDVIREVVVLAEGEARRTQATIRTEFAGQLPYVLGDRVQLQQVILNLVLNGLEAMHAAAGRSRDLVISTHRETGDRIRVAVQDSGCGMDSQSAARAFEPFYSTKTSGLGMGLSISRSIIDQHGGRLWAVSNDGPGTTFHFIL